MENKKGMRVFTTNINAIIFLLIISVAFLPETSAAGLWRGHAHPSRSRVRERPASPSPSPTPSPLAPPPLNKKMAASPHGGGIYHPLPDPY
ncbi:hypothetical protein E1A91_A05G417400v1 [Gossypium mustelinum]|uniref:Uncharacterized protein n=3 Tax=Gossypium TaxID=3633 RepID=A0A5J5VZG3_GOSBA|nr:hypothetical protein ES319_A05G404300v1 [Gossypium barbadense]TYI31151.1 hypothetical protein ES332_A05G433600v1 [Gossypium tomentosum]TYJ38068.1 hypothetical protein E1A91_A05G417400v1 [Gossypium mustelinum]